MWWPFLKFMVRGVMPVSSYFDAPTILYNKARCGREAVFLGCVSGVVFWGLSEVPSQYVRGGPKAKVISVMRADFGQSLFQYSSQNRPQSNGVFGSLRRSEEQNGYGKAKKLRPSVRSARPRCDIFCSAAYRAHDHPLHPSPTTATRHADFSLSLSPCLIQPKPQTPGL